MMPIKKCDFCSKDSVYVPINVSSKTSLEYHHILHVYLCHSCNAEYVCWGDNSKLVSTHLYVSINNKMYRWSISTGEDNARLWYVTEPGVPGVKPNKGLKLLKIFKDHPPVTPQNIEEKVRFMLPFL